MALPSEEAARLALRTQQVLAVETGVSDTVDPLGGSYYVESLTRKLEEAAADYLSQIEELGGSHQAIPFMRKEIHNTAYEYQKALESGTERVVGVNVYREAGEEPRVELPDFEKLAVEQRARLEDIKASRDEESVRRALGSVEEAASGEANVLPALIEAVKARATLGEISQVLRERWGEYRAT